MWFKWRPVGHIRPEITCNKSQEFLVSLLLVSTNSVIFFAPEDLKKSRFLSRRTSATHATVLKP
jgi:hypothetical protein